MPLRLTRLGLAAVLLVSPAAARAESPSLIDMAVNAAPVLQLFMLCIAVATLAAIIIAALKLLPGRLSGGSAFVSSLRFAGPVTGLLAAAYAGWKMSIGIATIGAPNLKVLGPGFAEIAFLVVIGAVSGLVAIALTWAIEARIDRQVLAE